MLSFSYCDLCNRSCHQNPWQYPSHRAGETRHDANAVETDDAAAAVTLFGNGAGDGVGAVADKDVERCALLRRTN